MASAGVLEQHSTPETMVEISDCSFSDKQEFHVLAVDDSLVDRKVIEKLLRISSFKVTAVNSGKRALQYLGLDGEKNSGGISGLNVNLIITDYSMPGMTGYELLKKIKESSAFREIPVVIMSSESILARINKCLDEGAEEYIVKPVKLSDVKRLKDFMLRGDVSAKASIRKRSFPDDCSYPSSTFTPLTRSASSGTIPALSTFPCSSAEHPPPPCRRRLHVRS